jgi:hypothetical protein
VIADGEVAQDTCRALFAVPRTRPGCSTTVAHAASHVLPHPAMRARFGLLDQPDRETFRGDILGNGGLRKYEVSNV